MESTDDGQTTGNKEREFDFSVSDFAKLVKTKSFVDKTLMIRDVFSRSSRILITAPPRFGKSTNIDMVKRFLEIEVDVHGTPKPVHTTNNYRLFKDNNLDIYKDKNYFNKHFGKHPVVYIDFEPLSGVRDFEHMLDAFRTVIRKSFIQHSYLFNANNANILLCSINGFDINDVKKYISNRLIKEVDPPDLVSRFEHLTTILYKYFGREVCVLIDNYDAFIKGMLVGKKDNPDTEKIISYIETTIENLVNNNKVGQVLLTGVIPVIFDESRTSGSYIDCYSFMGNHPFCKYFGLTSDELDSVLERLVLDEKEKSKMKTTIDEFYGGYVTANQRVQVYNIWSAMQYVHRQEVLNNRRYMQIFKPFFKNLRIRKKVALSIHSGYDSSLDISQTLSAADVSELKKVIITDNVNGVPSSVTDKLFLLLYHFGYFTIKAVLPNGCVSLQIPNHGIEYELANIYLEASQMYYDNNKIFNDIWLSIASFQPGCADTAFETFRDRIHSWLRKEPVPEQLSFFHVFRLYIILLAQSKYNETFYDGYGEGSDYFQYILLKNKHDVAICIAVSEISDPILPSESGVIINSAESLHKKITASGFPTVFKSYAPVCNKVIIAISYKGESSQIRAGVAYSYYFGEGDSLENYRTMKFGF